MKIRFSAPFAIGVAVVAIAVTLIVYMKRGARVGLTGQVLKVRTLALDDNSSLAVLDFRINNPSDVNFVVRTVTVVLEDPKGNSTEGDTVSEVDAKRMFEQLPILGQKYSTTLVMRDRVDNHTTQDRMVSGRFSLPESALQSRKRLLVRIEEVDGQISEISEK
jgi:hypothetical protein